MDSFGVGSKKELNLLGDLNFFPRKKDGVAAAPSREEQEMKEEKPFRCEYCTMAFSNPHALGGHQNAHKKERALDKILNPLGLPPNRFIESYSHPFRGVRGFPTHHPLARSPFGVNMHSLMISKPPRFPGSQAGSTSQLSMLLQHRLNAHTESARMKANGLNSMRNSLPEVNLSLSLWCGEKPPTSKSGSNNL